MVLFFVLTGTIKLIVQPQNVADFFAVIFLLLWLLFGFLVYSILKIPKIIISDEGILFQTVFKKREISWTDIETILLTGQRSTVFQNTEEVTTLVLKDSLEKVFIRVDCYKNSPEIRQLLERINTSIRENKSISVSFRDEPFYFRQPYKIKHDIPAGETFTKYSGTPYLNIAAITFYIVVLLLIIVAVLTVTADRSRLLFLLIPFTFFYLGTGSFFNYFLISDQHLVIKNAFWFWRRHVYEIDGLKEIVLDINHTNRMASKMMRVITKDFRTRSYQAAGLWTKHWRALKSRFESLGVNTRDHIGV